LGKIKPPEKAILFTAMLLSDEGILKEVKPVLKREFGEVLYETNPQDWNWSNYYREELGTKIKRSFIFFKLPIDSSIISDIKIKTNSIEEGLSVQGKRRVNIDPGYITLSKVVLASTKNYCHRIYLGKGIYGEVTLYYKENSFKPHLFTYRDYVDPSTIQVFNSVRNMIKELLTVPHPQKEHLHEENPHC
jgi:hypothetical protein